MRTFGLTVALYALAFVPMVLLYQARGPQWLTALGAGVVGLAFGAAVLGLAAPLRRAVAYALAIGLVLAEVGWAVAHWSVVSLVGGALLWLVFYVLAGVSQAHLDGSLDRRVAFEYVVVSALGLAIVLAATPWQ